jgi:CRISPR-associated RAMP protein (TIGR02581 family)
MLLDKFENKYIIKGTIINETGLHIGSGNDSLSPIQVDNSVIRDNNGNPFIPGSSLKGVLRSYVERMLTNVEERKSYDDEELYSCFIVSEPCIDNDEAKEIKKNKDSKEIAQQFYKRMCDVCKIFGCNHFSSRLQIKDMRLSDKKANIVKRDGVAIDRDTGTAADGKKYDFEVVSPGARFEFYMTLENIEEKHEDLLKMIIRTLRDGEIKIGGKTSAGLGDIILTEEKVYRIDKTNLKEYLINGLNDEMRWENV